ncbi:MAG: hypothetical protein QOG04_2295 [Actinomycetota bacterium]|nr:hypothetical protein [Actinomycetota bacterium]
MVVLGLISIVTGLGVSTLRGYWFTQSLYGGRDQVITQLRGGQEDVVSMSSPFVSGVRFRVNSSTWALVRYSPGANLASNADDTCVQVQSFTFGSGVKVTAADFTVVTGITDFCRSKLPGAATDQFALFFARGTATAGSVTLMHPNVASKSVTVTVQPMTGRVTGS